MGLYQESVRSQLAKESNRNELRTEKISIRGIGYAQLSALTISTPFVYERIELANLCARE